MGFLLCFSLFFLGCSPALKRSSFIDHSNEDSVRRFDSNNLRQQSVTQQGMSLSPDAVVDALDMDLEELPLGLVERRFQPCRHGLLRGNCSNHYLSILKVKILCRDSEGTTEYVDPSTMVALDSWDVDWKVGGQSGRVRSSRDGVLQIMVVGQRSIRGQRLILLRNSNSLGIRTQYARVNVVPSYWCR